MPNILDYIFSPNDNLNIFCPFNSGTETYIINCLVLGDNGPEFINYVWSPAVTTPSSFDINLSGYKLLYFSVNLSPGLVYNNTRFVRCSLSRGNTINLADNVCLVEGYIDSGTSLIFPSQYQMNNISDGLILSYVPLTIPGVNASMLLPAGFMSKVESVSFLYDASIVVVNRYPMLNITDPATGYPYFGISHSSAIVAGEHIRVWFSIGTPLNTIALGMLGSELPDKAFWPGFQLQFGCNFISALDSISEVLVTLRSFPL